ncbi:MAG: FAD-dependent thymidylate synthase [Candidatus Onthovivens sp.]|nr:FAD-dependent thymidylate synthase [Candidatus Onthovivens sp.]
MKIIEPSTEELFNPNPQKHIEFIARTCYKSEDKITEDSNKRMISNLYKNKHWAMLEHFIFIYKIDDKVDFYSSFIEILESEKYINVTMQKIDNDNRYIISFNARSILDMLNKYKYHDSIKKDIIKLIENVVYDYDCDELFGNKFKKVDYPCFKKIDDVTILTPIEQWIHGWHSIKFICDRGVSHEIVRHRDASFAQESTRYCNYTKDKFGKEITVIKPCYLKDGFDNPNNEMVAWGVWKRAIENSEKSYFEMLDLGCTAQEARTVLPNSLKTEVIMTARNYEWGHFFELRCDKAAHPQMKELAIPLLIDFTNRFPELFKETYNKIKELVI